MDESLPIRRLTEAGMIPAELAKLENTWRLYPDNRKQIAKFFAKLAQEDIVEWLEVQRAVGHFRTIYDPVTDPTQVQLDRTEALKTLTKAEVETLIEEGAVALAPKPSGDESGVKDAENLLEAQAAKGSLVLRSSAPYYATKLPVCGPEQGILCLGLPVVYMTGNEACLRIHDASMSTGGGEAEFLANIPGRFDPFIIDLTHAGSKAVGVWLGDINAMSSLGILVRHGTQAENVGWLLKSEVAWCERNQIVGYSINNTIGILFDNGGTATGAFDYSAFDFSIQAFANQHGVVMQKAIGLWGSKFRLTGNCFTGSSNTGVAWKLGVDNTAVQLLGTHIEIGLETDGTSGVGHKTIEKGTKAEVEAEGVLSYRVGGTVPWTAGNVTQPSAQFNFAGYVKVDENLGENQVGEGLNVLGGSTWSRGFSTVTGGKVEFGVNSGDYFLPTLASGVNILKLNNAYTGRAKRILAFLKQPLSGEPGTLNISEPGNNAKGEAQSISLSAGGSISLQGINGAIDAFELVTYDSLHWTIAPLTAPPATDSVLKIMRPVIAPSIVPSTESVIGTAFRAFFVRCIASRTGILHDLTVFNGTVVNGNHNVAVFDTGQASAGHYTPLWESGSVAAASENKAQVVASPELAVVAGEEYLLAVMNSGTTHKFGAQPSASHASWYQLPASFVPTSGGAFPKLLGQHNYAELKFAAITEAELEVEAAPAVVLLGRIV